MYFVRSFGYGSTTRGTRRGKSSMSHECERKRRRSWQHPLLVTRRHFFRECGVGVGKIALASLLTDAFAPQLFAAPPGGAPNPLAAKMPHFPPKAKRVIHLFMAGAPSQLDLFDYKPD